MLSPPQRLLGISGIGKIEGKKCVEAGEREKAIYENSYSAICPCY